jgi:ATP-binding cassette subfamily F protein 3
MSLLEVRHLKKYYATHKAVDDISFSIEAGSIFGLLGPNGAGKFTLLRILTGQEPPDSGSVSLSAGDTLGYLPQGIAQETGLSVQQAILSGSPELERAYRQLEALSRRLAAGEPAPDVLDAYGQALTRYEALGGYRLENDMAAILAGLGLADLDLDAPLRLLSGGERTRVMLARLLLSQPGILLLDEPTNHLDIAALEWLEEWLRSFRGAVLIVSHDRVFLDHTVRRILELDDESHQLREFAGNYSAYAAEVEREFAKQAATWRDQQAEIRRLEADITRTREQARSTEKGTNNDHQRRLAKKVAAKANAKEQRLKRYLEAAERVEKPAEKWRMRLSFGDPPRSGQIVAELAAVAQQFDGRWLFQSVNLTLQQGERVALVGPNGAGKTTLLRIITGAQAPTRGSVRIGPSVRIGYMPQQQETLDPAATVLDIVRAEAPMGQSELHRFLHFFLFEGDQLYLPVGDLSYGERARLLLARLVASGANCLLLDEPINHLDIPARQQFETALEAFPGAILVAAHDRAFIERVATSVWALEDGTVTRQFIKNIL